MAALAICGMPSAVIDVLPVTLWRAAHTASRPGPGPRPAMAEDTTALAAIIATNVVDGHPAPPVVAAGPEPPQL